MVNGDMEAETESPSCSSLEELGGYYCQRSGRVDLSGTECDQINPSGAKCVHVCPAEVKSGHVSPVETKSEQVSPRQPT